VCIRNCLVRTTATQGFWRMHSTNLSALFVLALILVHECYSADYTVNVQTSSATAGTASDQPFTALGTQDQSGTQDNWNKYIEYSKNFAGLFIWKININCFAGTFDFIVPSDVSTSGISSLQFVANLRKWDWPAAAFQWSLHNFVSNSVCVVLF